MEKMIDTEINSTGKDYAGKKIRGDNKTLSKKIGIIDKRQKNRQNQNYRNI